MKSQPPPDHVSSNAPDQSFEHYRRLVEIVVGSCEPPSLKQTKAIEEKRDRYWEDITLRLGARDESNVRRELWSSIYRFQKQLSLAGLPQSRPSFSAGSYAKRELAKLRQSPKKSQLAKIAQNGWAAFRSAERNLGKRKWDQALKSAIEFGFCLGRLSGKNASGSGPKKSPREKVLGSRLNLVDRSFLLFMRGNSDGGKKFDVQSMGEHDRSGKLKKIIGPGTAANLLSDWRKSLPPPLRDKTPVDRRELAARLLEERRRPKIFTLASPS